ncbi:MAG: hypothetical protein AB9903_04485 [Vulcanimicrobiota bacterium]
MIRRIEALNYRCLRYISQELRDFQVLCFSKTKTGAVDIISGNRHPSLINWKGEKNLGVLFAGGVLE